MSRWTHVVGCLYVDTYKEEKDIKSYIVKILENAPKITGSERDCDVFVNVLSGYNTSTNMDCEHCEYKDTIVHLDEGGFNCDAKEGYQCPEGKYQTCVAITIVGDLRDRDYYTTTKEIDKFIRYLQGAGRGCDLDHQSIIVRDDWDGDYILTIKYDDNNWEDKGKFLWKKVKFDV